MTLHINYKILFGFLLALIGNGCATQVPTVPPEKLSDYISSLGVTPSSHIIMVNARAQTLAIVKDNKIQKTFYVSTGKKGLGQRVNTNKTPVGLHRINEKIGAGVPKYGIFHKRNYIGTTAKKFPFVATRKDYISTRILRLEGLQKGLNKGKDWFGKTVDSEARGIYIHGTTREKALGSPVSKGCVHMSADDVITLFNKVPVGTLVWIN